MIDAVLMKKGHGMNHLIGDGFQEGLTGRVQVVDVFNGGTIKRRNVAEMLAIRTIDPEVLKWDADVMFSKGWVVWLVPFGKVLRDDHVCHCSGSVIWKLVGVDVGCRTRDLRRKDFDGPSFGRGPVSAKPNRAVCAGS